MFQLTKEEITDLRCKNCTSSWGGSRYLPYAFTEQGIYMLGTSRTLARRSLGDEAFLVHWLCRFDMAFSGWYPLVKYIEDYAKPPHPFVWRKREVHGS